MDSLDTPVLLVDEAVLEGNLRAMAGLAQDAGVDLRPHWKTHKCAEIARRQVALGAVGGTVAKAGEAEFFIEAGFDDVLIATPVVDPRKIERLLRKAADAGTTVTAMIESDSGRRAWSRASWRGIGASRDSRSQLPALSPISKSNRCASQVHETVTWEGLFQEPVRMMRATPRISRTGS